MKTIIQGMTGKEGQRMARWMIASGTEVVAGVTPGKGGQEVEGRPIFSSVAEAVAAFPDLQASSVAVPPFAVRSAVEDALNAGIPLVHVLTENVPVHDVILMRSLATQRGAMILGPSSVGMIEMPSFRLGYLGGESPFTTLVEGGLAILSTSGGMTNEIVMACGRRRIGVRAVMSLGGDRVAVTTLAEAIARMETREDVKAIAIFVEPGNPWLREAAAPTKPTAVMLPGNALESLPRGLPYGHTGTILGEDEPRLVDVRSRIVAQGMKCTDRLSEFLDACESL